MTAGEPADGGPIRVLRVIARMNMGGPAYHVALLTEGLGRLGYQTVVACGNVGPGEEEMAGAVSRLSPPPRRIPALGPALSPVADLAALRELRQLVRSVRPHIVHTHTAKAGFLGRLAAVLGPGRRPVLVHTYHGHVLEGYFGPLVGGTYRQLEKLAARVSDRLVGVSQATVDDLVRLGIARRDRFSVIPLGLELDEFLGIERPGPLRSEARAQLSAGPDDVLVLFVGRFAPVKRLDVLLDATASARAGGAPIRLVLVGDGELRASLEQHARRLGIAESVHFAGYRDDLAGFVAAADIAALSSDNEGTPVSLIQAAAGGLPLVSTDVGGVAEVVVPASGLLTPAGDPAALGTSLATLAHDPALRRSMGSRATEHARAGYRAERLVADIDRLYRELLAAARKSS